MRTLAINNYFSISRGGTFHPPPLGTLLDILRNSGAFSRSSCGCSRNPVRSLIIWLEIRVRPALVGFQSVCLSYRHPSPFIPHTSFHACRPRLVPRRVGHPMQDTTPSWRGVLLRPRRARRGSASWRKWHCRSSVRSLASMITWLTVWWPLCATR